MESETLIFFRQNINDYRQLFLQADTWALECMPQYQTQPGFFTGANKMWTQELKMTARVSCHFLISLQIFASGSCF